MWPTAIRKLTLIPRAGAVSVLALLTVSGAGHASDQLDYGEARDWRIETDSDRGYGDYGRGALNDGRRSGIDGARIAHRRYSDYRAEQIDGDCESRVRIQYGESLSDIAEFCDVPLRALIDSNPSIYNPNRISVGQQVFVPNISGNVYDGGQHEYGYSHAVYEGNYQSVDASYYQEDRNYYVVRRGDTINEIALRFDVSRRELARLNPNLRQPRLQIGTRVYLPSGSQGSDDWYGSERPAIAISPSHGPRNGAVRVTGDNFRRDEQVSVLYGEDRNSLVRIRTIEADRQGRIDEIVRLPTSYDEDEAFFAIRRGADTFMSQPYEVDRRSAGLRDLSNEYRDRDDRDGGYRNYDDDYRDNNYRDYDDYRDTVSVSLTAVDRDVYWDEKVSLTAQGFPANTIVSIFGGPDRNTMVRLGETRSGSRGQFEAEVSVPTNVGGDSVIFAASTSNGARPYFTERVHVRGDERGGRDDSGHYELSSTRTEPTGGPVRLAATTPTTLDRGVKRTGKVTFLSGFGRKDDLRGAGGINSGGKSAISGVLTNEGKNCPALRDDAGKLYTLLGDLDGFDDGDRVLISGTAAVDDRICDQSETIQVFAIDRAPW